MKQDNENADENIVTVDLDNTRIEFEGGWIELKAPSTELYSLALALSTSIDLGEISGKDSEQVNAMMGPVLQAIAFLPPGKMAMMAWRHVKSGEITGEDGADRSITKQDFLEKIYIGNLSVRINLRLYLQALTMPNPCTPGKSGSARGSKLQAANPPKAS
jgi:hypothetical protein